MPELPQDSMANSSDYKLLNELSKYAYSANEITFSFTLIIELEQRNTQNVTQFVTRLIESASDREKYGDYLAEGTALLLLSQNKFNIIYEPCGKKGPDALAVGLDYRFHVEFARFREDVTACQRLHDIFEDGIEILVPYGRGDRDVKKLYDKILQEALQLPKNEIGLVFLKSDNIPIEDIEFTIGAEDLSDLISSGNSIEQLSGVLFDAGWINLHSFQRFYLWRNPLAKIPIDDLLAEKLINMQYHTTA